MATPKKPLDADKQAQILAQLRRDQEIQRNSYRARALKLFPHVCGRCKREFSGRRLQELTVHHKDHNFRNNPNDGSNWELLCTYCHADEHEKVMGKGYSDNSGTGPAPSTIFNPFGGLEGLLNTEGGRQ
ncbi:MAG: YajD family HNH nuclease [bacterium]